MTGSFTNRRIKKRCKCYFSIPYIDLDMVNELLEGIVKIKAEY